MTTGKRNDSVGIIVMAAWLLASLLFLHIPATIYQGNATEFAFSLRQLFLPLGAAFLVVGILLSLPVLVKNPGVLRLYGGLLASLACYGWVAGQFIVADFGELDGTPLHFAASKHAGLLELAAIILGLVVVAKVAMTYQRFVAFFLGLLNLGLVVVTAVVLLHDQKESVAQERSELQSAFFRFAETENLLVVLMDHFQADLFAEIIDQEPAFKRELDGFTFFRDFLGVARTTILTMPALHSGIQFDIAQTLQDYAARTLETRTFLTDLAASGGDVVYLNANAAGYGCLRGVAFCPPEQWILDHNPAQTFVISAGFLADLAIFRAAPRLVKPLLYNHGRWRLRTLASFIGLDAHSSGPIRSNLVLQALATHAYRSGRRPAVKFLHLFNTHPPLVIGADCMPVRRPLPLDREHFLHQARCAFLVFLDLLRSLKAAELYDDTYIILMADTGAPLRSAALPAADQRFAELVGSANPVFVAKPPGSSGSFQVSDVLVQTTDVPATVCQFMTGCTWEVGQSAFMRADTRARQRRFHWYTIPMVKWRHQFYETLRRPLINEYLVTGPLSALKSWTLLSPVTHLRGRVLMEGRNRVVFSGFAGDASFTVSHPPLPVLPGNRVVARATVAGPAGKEISMFIARHGQSEWEQSKIVTIRLTPEPTEYQVVHRFATEHTNVRLQIAGTASSQAYAVDMTQVSLATVP